MNWQQRERARATTWTEYANDRTFPRDGGLALAVGLDPSLRPAPAWLSHPRQPTPVSSERPSDCSPLPPPRPPDPSARLREPLEPPEPAPEPPRCKRGHDLSDPTSVYVNGSDGRRRCRSCRQLKARERLECRSAPRG